MKRCRSWIEQDSGGRPVLGRSCLRGVAAPRRGRLRRIFPNGANITGKLPNLLRCQLVAVGRHAMGTAVTDRSKDGMDLRSVQPPAVEKGGTNAAFSLSVAFL